MFDNTQGQRAYFEEAPPDGWSFDQPPSLDALDAAYINQALDSTDPDQCITVLAQAERYKNFWSSIQARAAARIDSLTGCTPDCHPVIKERGTAHLVALARRKSQNGSLTYLRAMRSLIPDMPYTFSRFERGDLSEAMILAILTPLDDLNAAEHRDFDDLYARAPGMFDNLCTKEARELAQKYVDGLHSEERTVKIEEKASKRHVRFRKGQDCLLLNASLPIDEGMALMDYVDREARKMRAAGDTRSLDQLRTDILVRNITGEPINRPLCAKLHLNLIMTDTTLFLAENGVTTMPGYGSLPAEYARRLAKAWEYAGEDSPEEVLKLFAQRISAFPMLRKLYLAPNEQDLVAMDSRERSFTGGLRSLIQLRDPFCRTPHCNNTPRHVDHVMQHAQGGPTNVGNGAGRCAACNLAKESPGWREAVVSLAPHKIRIRPTSAVEFTSTSPALVGLIRMEQILGGSDAYLPPVPVRPKHPPQPAPPGTDPDH